MSNVITKPLTADAFYEWCQLPENAERRCELIRGEIIDMPSPGQLHGFVCGIMSYLLMLYIIQGGQGRVYSHDTGLIVSEDTVLGPDLILYANELPSVYQMAPGHLRPIPTLCVEVVSPSNSYTEMNRKARAYLQAGVELVWVVDPDVRNVQVFSQTEFAKHVDETETLTGNGVLPGLSIPVADLFRQPS